MTAVQFFPCCGLVVNALCKLINVIVFGSVVLYSRKCRMLKLVYSVVTSAGIGWEFCDGNQM